MHFSIINFGAEVILVICRVILDLEQAGQPSKWRICSFLSSAILAYILHSEPYEKVCISMVDML